MKNCCNMSNKCFTSLAGIALLAVIFLLKICTAVNAQSATQSNQSYIRNSVPENEPCITREMHLELNRRTQANISKLKAEGSLFTNPPQTAIVTQTFAWPLTYTSDFYDNEYYYIQNYIDHDPTTGPLIDYNCGERTYDKPNGYDHTGTDICIGPYHWSMMDLDYVHVIAAAPGQIVDKDDGNFDRNCGFGAGSPNFVKIMHSDGSYAIYYHMKSGSVTSKIIGDLVEQGEYLGLVGSSGSSTNPHLHFEVLDQSSNVVDPWVGPCNPDITNSLWNNQLPYHNPGILRLMTLSGPVPSSNCPDPEPLTIKNHFNPFDFARFEIHLRDLVDGLLVGLTVTDPSGIQVIASTYTNSGGFSASGYYFTSVILPATTGTYKMSVTYSGKSAVHYFTVGCPGAYNLSAAHSGKKGYVSGSSITSTSVISGSASNNIWYEAESYVQVNPGFKATAGSTFTARINNCTIGNAKESELSHHTESTPATLIALPSLASSQTNIEFTLSSNDRISIGVYDLTGRLIRFLIKENQFKKGNHQLEFNTTGLSNGSYLIKMTGIRSEATCKLMVQR